MIEPSTPIHLVSDFNIEPLARYLRHDPGFPKCDVEVAPFGQVCQTLLEEASSTRSIGVVWARPESVIERFASALDFEPIDPEGVLADVRSFARMVSSYAQRQRNVLLATFVLSPEQRGYGLIDWRAEIGLRHLLARMNLELAAALAGERNVFLLDADLWLRAGGLRAASPRSWLAGRIPYSNVVFQEATREVKAALRGLLGRTTKVIILDLDNTLWGGVVGETGWQGLCLGGHSLKGEAFKAFQRALKSYASRGIQLAIVSKNDEAVALEAIDHHPEMVLRKKDFAGWRIDWIDKATNVAALLRELNLGLDAAVFLDDSPMERARVAETLPEVIVPEWPDDPSEYVAALHGLRLFDVTGLSREDRARTEMYAAERARREAREALGSLDEWLESLSVRVHVSPLLPETLPRAAQLFNKTNQFNLSTRRLSEVDLESWTSQPDHQLFTVSVSDRFGDSGLTGILSLCTDGMRVEIKDFILSCRVMGRRVEDAMLHFAGTVARRSGAEALVARYRPTERNAPCRRFLEGHSLEEVERDVFVLPVETALPRGLELQISP